MRKQRLDLLVLFLAALLAACSDDGIEIEKTTPTTPDEPVVTEDILEFAMQDNTLDNGVLHVSSSGGTSSVIINTNLEETKIGWKYYDNGIINAESTNSESRTATRKDSEKWAYAIPISRNDGAHSRSTSLIVCNLDDESLADTLVIVQDGTALKTSTDFSKDKSVEQIYTHKEGNGIPVVMIGDGFGDTEVNNGDYKTTMLKAVDYLFSEQPMTALKPNFDVYMVTAVSKQNDVGQCYNSVFNSVMASDGSTDITADYETVNDYAGLVREKYNLAKDFIDNALVIVILNNNSYAGITYMWYKDKKDGLNKAQAFCPVIGGLEDERFRTVLVHEGAGHGFGKLGDEYFYDDQASISDDDKKELEMYHGFGWQMNLSLSDSKTPWDKFLSDTYYTSEPDCVGIWQGAYWYPYGVWRPTDNSMMNNNDYPFNAPSRKIIYDKVLERNGKKASTMAEFKAFDQANAPDFGRYKSSSEGSRATSPVAYKKFAKPKIIKLTR